jgi:uncharacterized protein YcbK (DUF882 family)
MEQHGQTSSGVNRRGFLAYGAVAAAAALAPLRANAAGPAAAATARVKAPIRTLSFFHTHTGERLKTTYCCDGRYDPDALNAINVLLRDFRVNKVKAIDPRLLDLLNELSGTLETDQPFHIISGYRAPETNQMLRSRGGAHTGVASQSLHMVGKAIDIRLPGVKLDNLRGAARSLKLGGVGYYPSSNFVHVDTGRVRFW